MGKVIIPEMKININTRVRVKLTENGKKIARSMGYLHNCDEDEMITELWSIMKTFGSSIWMGMNEVPFQDNLIEFLEPIETGE